MTTLTTAVFIERFGVYKIVSYDGPTMWEAVIGDPFVHMDSILSSYSSAPPAAFRNALNQVMSTMRNAGQSITETVKEFHIKQCPCGKACAYSKGADLSRMIIHLNDNKQWTRERIADWLDTLDEQPVFHPGEGIRNFNTTNLVTYQPALSKDASPTARGRHDGDKQELWKQMGSDYV